MKRRLGIAVATAFTLAVGSACIDTSLPDFQTALGTGPTDGPFCTPEEIETFAPETLRIHVIDVGQGDAIWVQTPYYEEEELESLDILIDAGPSGNVDGTSPGGATVVDYMTRRGTPLGERIHALIVTHAHEDHYGGVEALAAAFRIEGYVDPGFTAGSQGFLAARNVAATEVTENAGAGQVYFPAVPTLVSQPFQPTDLFGSLLDDARVLWAAEVPPSGNTTNPDNHDVNNTSVVFSLSWRGRRVLLMGDAEKEVEAELVAAEQRGDVGLSASVLKVGHHGSASSSTPAFLDRVFAAADSQTWAVISSGRRSFGGTQLPAASTVTALNDRLERYHVLSTENRDQDKDAGTEHGDDHVMIIIDGEGTVRACYAPQ